MKTKLLCILHLSPPAHGAAKVGDFIAESRKLQENFDCKFITIKSSETIGDIGKVSLKKLLFTIELYIKILVTLLSFRPSKIYFTPSVKGVAFYRDVIIATTWMIYRIFKKTDIYYHYHTKGIDQFVSTSYLKLLLTNFFLKNVNVILLSPLLSKDLDRIDNYRKILFLPNGVEDNIENEEFDTFIQKKYATTKTIHILYLAHMIKDKGYWEVLELANYMKQKNIHFHFAGGWKDKGSKDEFFQYIKKNRLENKITYHGFISGDAKKILFQSAHVLLYPSKNDAFPLTILESLSYGVPVLATSEGSIPYILDKKSGIIITDISSLQSKFNEALKNLINTDVATYCRKRYLDNFSLETFENNLKKLLQN